MGRFSFIQHEYMELLIKQLLGKTNFNFTAPFLESYNNSYSNLYIIIWLNLATLGMLIVSSF